MQSVKSKNIITFGDVVDMSLWQNPIFVQLTDRNLPDCPHAVETP